MGGYLARAFSAEFPTPSSVATVRRMRRRFEGAKMARLSLSPGSLCAARGRGRQFRWLLSVTHFSGKVCKLQIVSAIKLPKRTNCFYTVG